MSNLTRLRKILRVQERIYALEEARLASMRSEQLGHEAERRMVLENISGTNPRVDPDLSVVTRSIRTSDARVQEGARAIAKQLDQLADADRRVRQIERLASTVARALAIRAERNALYELVDRIPAGTVESRLAQASAANCNGSVAGRKTKQ